MAEEVNSGRSFLPPEFVVASPCLTESLVGLLLLGSQRANPDRGHFGWSSFFATGFPPVRMTIPLPPVGMITSLGPGWRYLKAGLIQ